MDKHEIEQELATEMQALIAGLASGNLTQEEYEEHVHIVHRWANEAYSTRSE